MKNNLVILVTLFTILTAHGMNFQSNDSLSDNNKKKYLISFSIGNNGQIKNIIDYFYLNAIPEYFLKNSSKETDLKYNLSLYFYTSNYYYFKIKSGFTSIQKKNTDTRNNNEIFSLANQKIYNINPSFGKVFNFDKIEFAFGIEVPLFIIGNHNFTQEYKSYWIQNGTKVLGTNYLTKASINGGYIFGINSILSLKYFFKSKLFFTSQFSSGLLNANIGGDYIHETETLYIASFLSPNTYSPDSKVTVPYNYRKTFYSNSEVSFGMGFKF